MNTMEKPSEPSRKSIALSVAILTVPFFLAYFFIRSLPVEPCDFLHAKTYNSSGVLDYCGPGDSAFVDLTQRSWPLTLELEALDEPRIGAPCRFRAKISQYDGTPLGADDVALSHTKKIHLLVIDSSLEDYSHVHPVPVPDSPGDWLFSVTPSRGGEYKMFFDFIPIRSPRRVLLTSTFQFPGESSSHEPAERSKVQLSGYSFSMTSESPSFLSGEDAKLRLEVHDESGKPVAFEPVMGAFAHMVAFDDDRRGFAHLHPGESIQPVDDSEDFVGSLTFGFRPPSSGHFRLWAQVRIGGEELFVPFDLIVDA